VYYQWVTCELSLGILGITQAEERNSTAGGGDVDSLSTGCVHDFPLLLLSKGRFSTLSTAPTIYYGIYPYILIN
jgi:hypothetical protein